MSVASNNLDFGASKDLKSDVNNIKVGTFLSKFINEKAVYIQADQRSNIKHNGDDAENRMDNTQLRQIIQVKMIIIGYLHLIIVPKLGKTYSTIHASIN